MVTIFVFVKARLGVADSDSVWKKINPMFYDIVLWVDDVYRVGFFDVGDAVYGSFDALKSDIVFCEGGFGFVAELYLECVI